MSKFLRAAVLATFVMGASAAQAQTVGMAGEYSESNGIVVQIPQNPPNVSCVLGETQGGAVGVANDARCINSRQGFGFDPAGGGTSATAGPDFRQKPSFGVYGAQNIPTQGAGPGVQNNAAGLNPGDPFLVPPLAFSQRLGQQVGIVLNNVTIQLDTTFTAAAPGTTRTKNPQANERLFNANNWSAENQQNNGLTAAGGAARAAAATTFNFNTPAVNEIVAVKYSPGANAFGGVMSILLDGGGRLYLAGANIDGIFAAVPGGAPIVGTNPVGDDIPGFNIRNAAGWDYTVTGSQMAGQFKGFGPGLGVPATVASAVVAGACDVTPPPSPAGCNQINGFDANGVFLAPLPGATSTKHMFAWTTGTVSVIRTGIRNGITFLDTATAMGYDTTSTMGGDQYRNVGMVAGSFSVRTDGQPATQINQQMAAVNLKFTPEPGATVALISGLGLLGGLAARRRS